MVSSLATKIHKTLHHLETDETMVGFCDLQSAKILQQQNRYPFSHKIPMVHLENQSSSWVEEIGVVLGGMI